MPQVARVSRSHFLENAERDVEDPLADLLAKLNASTVALNDAASTLGTAETIWISAKEAEDIKKKIDSFAAATGQTETVLKLSETTIKLIEVLPTIGSIVKTAQLASVANAAENAAGQANDAALEAKAQWESITKKTNTVDDVLSKSKTALETAGTVVGALALTLGDLSARYVAARDLQSDRADDPDSAASLAYAEAFEALETRYVAVAQPLVAVEQTVNALTQEIEGLVASIAAATDDVTASLAPIQSTLSDMAAAVADLAPVQSALNSFTAPLDAVFDFLENPPSIPDPLSFVVVVNPFDPQFPGYFTDTINLFPPIQREDIQAVIDFIDGISGTVLSLLDPILAPVINLIKGALDPLLSVLDPVTDVINPINALKSQFNPLTDAIEDVLLPLQQLEASFGALEAISGTSFSPEEMTQPLQDETRETFFGDEADNFVFGAAKADVASAGRADGTDLAGAVLSGGGGADILIGTSARDLLIGGDDADILVGGGEVDVIVGGDGSDTILGGSGADVIEGGDGDDTLLGEFGADDISGGAGADFVDGGGGRDRIDSGTENDILIGGAAADTFVFSAGDGFDVIVDFVTGLDLLEFNGTQAAGAFVIQGNTWVSYGTEDFVLLAGLTDPVNLDTLIA